KPGRQRRSWQSSGETHRHADVEAPERARLAFADLDIAETRPDRRRGNRGSDRPLQREAEPGRISLAEPGLVAVKTKVTGRGEDPPTRRQPEGSTQEHEVFGRRV